MDEEILAGLHDLRMIPIDGFEIVAAVALGLLIAGTLGIVFLMFRKAPKPDALESRIALARKLPDAQRTLALAGLLKDLTDQKTPGAAPWPERAERAFDLDARCVNLLKQLYEPGALPDPDAIERAVLNAERS